MKKFDIDNLFLRLYIAYGKCKAVLYSCITQEQFQTTGDWIAEVIGVFEDEFELYLSHVSKRKQKEYMDRFICVCKAMTDEFSEYVTNHPLMQETKEGEPVYPKQVVVRGFERMFDEDMESSDDYENTEE